MPKQLEHEDFLEMLDEVLSEMEQEAIKDTVLLAKLDKNVDWARFGGKLIKKWAEAIRTEIGETERLKFCQGVLRAISD